MKRVFTFIFLILSLNSYANDELKLNCESTYEGIPSEVSLVEQNGSLSLLIDSRVGSEDQLAEYKLNSLQENTKHITAKSDLAAAEGVLLEQLIVASKETSSGIALLQYPFHPLIGKTQVREYMLRLTNCQFSN